MTTFYPFTPSQTQAFTFQPALDGTQYLVTVQWNLFGQRYYIFVTQLNGTPVVTMPIIESPAALPLASISWSNGKVTAVTQRPHGYQIGLTVAINIVGCAPVAYNGSVFAFVLDAVTLVYPLTANPAGATIIGAADWTINMMNGYFFTSTMVYRNGQFEINP
jgi:hypothetical protein